MNRIDLKQKAKELFLKFDSDPFPPTPGNCVYAVFVFNGPWIGAMHLVYIGSTKNLEKRRNMEKHPYRICLDRFQGKSVCVMDFKSDSHIEDEAILIKYFKPIFNKRGK